MRYLFLLIFATFIIWGCEDNCEGVNCGIGECVDGICHCPTCATGVSCETNRCKNDGVCAEGGCICLGCYAGEFCEFFNQYRFVGFYAGSTLDCAGFPYYQVSIQPPNINVADNNLVIKNLFNNQVELSATIISCDSIEIVGKESGDNTNIRGKGGFNTNTGLLIVDLSYTQNATQDSCSITLAPL